MRKLFLSSQGVPPQLKQAFFDFLGRDAAGLKMAHIPTASNPYPKKEWVVDSRQEMKDFGIEIVDIDLEQENPTSLQERLSKVDLIFVNGGNTFYLLDWVRKSGFDKVLPTLLSDGKIYIGLSAGSLIVGPSIESSSWDPNWDENIANLTDLSGLGLVPFSIVPHFREKENQTINDNAAHVSYPVVALMDGQAIVVEGDSWTIVGEGPHITLNH